MAKSDLQEKVAQFMRGRNGADELSVLLVELAILLGLINIFAAKIWLSMIVIALLAYAIFRMVSTQVAARRRESYAVMHALGPVRPWVTNPRKAFQEARLYKHASCPNCHQRVRVPRGKGRIRVTCPQCGNKFELKS